MIEAEINTKTLRREGEIATKTKENITDCKSISILVAKVSTNEKKSIKYDLFHFEEHQIQKQLWAMKAFCKIGYEKCKKVESCSGNLNFLAAEIQMTLSRTLIQITCSQEP